MEKKIVHIEDFFTADTAKEGMWHEPKFGREGCGFEFLVIGATTDESMAADEHFAKLYSEAEDIKDPIERHRKQMEVDAKRCAKFVKGIREAKDCSVDFQGKPIEYSEPFIEQIFLKSPEIKIDIVNFAKNNLNFIKREKNA